MKFPVGIWHRPLPRRGVIYDALFAGRTPRRASWNFPSASGIVPYSVRASFMTPCLPVEPPAGRH